MHVTGVTIHRGGVLVGSSTSSDERREKQTMLGDARDVHFGARGLHPVQGLCTNPRRSLASCLHENSVPDTSFWMQETRLWPPSVCKATDRARFFIHSHAPLLRCDRCQNGLWTPFCAPRSPLLYGACTRKRPSEGRNRHLAPTGASQIQANSRSSRSKLRSSDIGCPRTNALFRPFLIRIASTGRIDIRQP